MLNVNITDQNISVSGDTAVSDSVKYLKIKFTYSAEWNIFTKTAVFRNAALSEPVCLLLSRENEVSENTFYVPFEVIKAPEFSVCVFGEHGDSLITTEELSVIVHQSGYAEGVTPSEPIPDIYQQLIATSDATYAVAQSVREDADNGVFKGDKGDKGDTGDTGDTGPAGPQGIQGIQGVKGDKGDKGDRGEQGIQGVKGDKGDDGDTPTIDQTYSATSTNAQSGTAVAQAIASIPTPSSNMEWESVLDVTLTADIARATYEIPNYQNYKGFLISAKAPNGITQASVGYLFRIYCDTDVPSTATYTASTVASGGTNKVLCEAVILPFGNMYLNLFSGNAASGTNVMSPLAKTLLQPNLPFKFSIQANSTNAVLVAGVQITVLGLKEATV